MRDEGEATLKDDFSLEPLECRWRVRLAGPAARFKKVRRCAPWRELWVRPPHLRALHALKRLINLFSDQDTKDGLDGARCLQAVNGAFLAGSDVCIQLVRFYLSPARHPLRVDEDGDGRGERSASKASRRASNSSTFSLPSISIFLFSPSLSKEKAPGDNYESRYPWKPLCLMVNEAETYRLRRRIGSDKSAGKWLPAGD